jgi:hypothetical protein
LYRDCLNNEGFCTETASITRGFGGEDNSSRSAQQQRRRDSDSRQDSTHAHSLSFCSDGTSTTRFNDIANVSTCACSELQNSGGLRQEESAQMRGLPVHDLACEEESAQTRRLPVQDLYTSVQDLYTSSRDRARDFEKSALVVPSTTPLQSFFQNRRGESTGETAILLRAARGSALGGFCTSEKGESRGKTAILLRAARGSATVTGDFVPWPSSSSLQRYTSSGAGTAR